MAYSVECKNWAGIVSNLKESQAHKSGITGDVSNIIHQSLKSGGEGKLPSQLALAETMKCFTYD